MTYTCPKCGTPMVCVSTLTYPTADYRYVCNQCGYSSKVIRTSDDIIPLPKEYQEEGEPK